MRGWRTGAGGNVVVEQLIGGETEALRHLRNHLVGSAVEAEIVEISTTKKPAATRKSASVKKSSSGPSRGTLTAGKH